MSRGRSLLELPNNLQWSCFTFSFCRSICRLSLQAPWCEPGPRTVHTTFCSPKKQAFAAQSAWPLHHRIAWFHGLLVSRCVVSAWAPIYVLTVLCGRVSYWSSRTMKMKIRSVQNLEVSVCALWVSFWVLGSFETKFRVKLRSVGFCCYQKRLISQTSYSSHSKPQASTMRLLCISFLQESEVWHISSCCLNAFWGKCLGHAVSSLSLCNSRGIGLLRKQAMDGSWQGIKSFSGAWCTLYHSVRRSLVLWLSSECIHTHSSPVAKEPLSSASRAAPVLWAPAATGKVPENACRCTRAFFW